MDVEFDEVLKVLVEFGAVVHAVALKHHHFVDFDKFSGGDALSLPV